MSLSWKVGIWKEGKHVDLWHINHFLSGVLCAGVVLIFDINLLIGFITSFVLMVGWEGVEVVSNIRETKFNMYTDVVLSTLAFFLVIILDKYFLSKSEVNILLYISTGIFVVLGVWGFWAYKKREKAKKNK